MEAACRRQLRGSALNYLLQVYRKYEIQPFLGELNKRKREEKRKRKMLSSLLIFI